MGRTETETGILQGHHRRNPRIEIQQPHLHTDEPDGQRFPQPEIGQTEKKIKEEIEKARGGVLFIDKAYTLVAGHDPDSRDYGKEVINALLPVLSDPNPDLIVIFAGYEDKMTELLRTNSGRKEVPASRIGFKA